MFSANTEKDREEMLKAIGVSSIRDLLKQVPGKYLYPAFDLPETSLDEQQTARRMKALAARNTAPLSFLGAGAYERYIPAAVKALISRGEYLTAYTPYQAEASQGILQTIYEYQSSVCALYAMDCANASMYDGASAFGEAVRAAVRITGKKKILCQETLNPQYLQTLKTYFADSAEYQFVTVPHKDGLVDPEKLSALLSGDTACVAFQTPNFFGLPEDAPGISEMAHKAGALVVTAADPASLGLFAPPGEYSADFAVGEGQSLGLPLSYGGPYLGIFSCKKEYVRQMPGRIAGMTRDKDGKRGFVLTLQAREQHIRRDKAASNICSNEALCALSATIYLALLGPEGLKELALANARAAAFAAGKLSAVKGAALKFKAPFFNEFVLEVGDAARLRERILAKDHIDIGLPLKDLYPALGQGALLVCATETKTEEDILRLEKALRENI
ncbi:MAG: glycine dehydrogenase (aminomethyl-transferring) [Elusimicrobia bacterium GWA2_56_46]|nr:MAG: glycine dehydrogenase (aminomethyl-transferring) [Elusimicrobia bacterium GWA2_56_46]OGR55140.1 MAG: glycine dehydrogenase (aminomethyl-transferring) [Elusimicrobia bacterium GWC2_56_31]HBW22288.1 aminomethyl-transferring glycine dehydrogenase subunit GcvPA [Elusimicrobiota bacterium]